MAAPPALITSSTTALSDALAIATKTWENELKSLLKEEKPQYVNIDWDVKDGDGESTNDIWGHQAVISALASPAFQEKCIETTATNLGSMLDSSSTQSATTSPQVYNSFPLEAPQPTQPLVSVSNKPSPTRVPLTVDCGRFASQLEFPCTGRGTALDLELSTSDRSAHAIDVDPIMGEKQLEQLRQNLANIWKSRSYSDIQITLDRNSSGNVENASTVLSAHRLILVSRVPYFRSLLPTSFPSVSPRISSANPLQLNLPSPPFTSESLHFTLGFIYTGTMAFDDTRVCNLETSFDVIRSAKFLGLDTLENEARARIVSELMHGLFYAYVPFAEYERTIEGKWGTGGCKCEQCRRYAPRVLEFALGDDMRDNVLERGAGRALACMYGEGWATPEFLALPPRVKKTILKDVKYRTVPHNIIPLLQATQAGFTKLSSITGSQAEVVKDLMLLERKKIDEILCNNIFDFLEQPEWVGLLESGDVEPDKAMKFDLVLDSIRRGFTDDNVGRIYQNLVSLVLLRTDPTTGRPILSSNSPLKTKIEHLRVDTLTWMKRRWSSVRKSTCFHGLEPWALKDISADLGVFVQEMVTPNGPRTSNPRKGARASFSSPNTGGGARLVSTNSLYAKKLDQNTCKTNGTPSQPARPSANQTRPRDQTARPMQNSCPARDDVTTIVSAIAPADHSYPSSTNTSADNFKQQTPDASNQVDRIPSARQHSKKEHTSSCPPGLETHSDCFLEGSPGADSCNGSASKETTISKQMDAHDIISHLVARGCRDLTKELDLKTFSEHPISHGGFSDIYRGRLSNKTPVAIKALRTLISENKHFKHAARELHIWRKCTHPNILPLHGLAEFRGRIGMVSPWMERGSLPRYLERTPGVDRCNLCVQICDGLSYLHSIGIIHGDLKGTNVLVSDDGTPVLTDFGNSLHPNRSINFTETTSMISLTVRWAAPELLAEPGPPTEASDVYALAMTIYEILTGNLPYDGVQPLAILTLVVVQKEPPERPEGIPSGCDDGDKLWKLLLRCWSFDPKVRPSASEVTDVMRTITSAGLSSINTPMK